MFFSATSKLGPAQDKARTVAIQPPNPKNKLLNKLDNLGIPEDIKNTLIDHIDNTYDVTNADAIKKNVEWYALACIYYGCTDKNELFSRMGITVMDGSNNKFTTQSLLNCKQYEKFTLLQFLQVVDSDSPVDERTRSRSIINWKSLGYDAESISSDDSEHSFFSI